MLMNNHVGYPVLFSSFWEPGLDGGVQVYNFLNTGVYARHFDLRGATFDCTLLKAGSLSTSVGNDGAIHAHMTAQVQFTPIVDPTLAAAPSVAGVASSATPAPVAQSATADITGTQYIDGSGVMKLGVRIVGADGTVLFDSQGEQTLIAGSVWIGY